MSDKKRKVPKLRFPGFTDDWEQRKLGDYLEVSKEKNKDGKFDKEDVLSVSGSYGIVNQIEFQGRSFAGASVANYGVVKIGDVVYTKSPLKSNPYGIIKTNKVKTGIVSTLYAVYSPLKNTHSDFIQTYFEQDARMNNYMSPLVNKGAKNDMKVSDENALKGEVVFPSKEEQFKISEYFERLNNLISLHQRKLDNIKMLKKSLLQKLFPKDGEKIPELRFPGFTDAWEQRKLGDVINSFSGGTPSASNVSYYGGNIPFIRSGEIKSETTELYLTEEGLQDSSAKLVEAGDILYALYGATSGEVAISRINGAINQAILAIRPYPGYSSKFLLQWLQLQKESIIEKYIQGGQGNLSGAIVKGLTIDFAQSIEQDKIGTLFDYFDNLISLHQRKLDHLKELKKGLLQQMFV